MHIVRKREPKRNGGGNTYLLLRHTFRVEGGEKRERLVYLGPEKAADLEERADKVLRRVGYTPAQRKAILAAVRVRADRNEHLPITVRGKLVSWRDPSK